MSEKPFLNTADLAARWQCSESTIRNAKPEELPARFMRPGSRQVLYPLAEVLAYERVHTEARDYEAELKLGAASVLGRLSRGTHRGKGGRL